MCGVHGASKSVGVGLNCPRSAFWGLSHRKNDICFSPQVVDYMVGAGRFERPTPCAQGGWEEAAKAACFQVLAEQGVVADLLKPVEPR